MITLLDIVKERDNFPYYNPSRPEEYTNYVQDLYHFYLPNDSRPHGFITPSIVDSLPWSTDFEINHTSKPRTIKLLPASATSGNAAIDTVLQKARENEIFHCLRGWRNEEYRILGSNSDLKIERAGAGLFGIITIGAHMTVFTRFKETGELKIWVPTRSMSTTTFPGRLDSSVAGGVAIGVEPFECLVKEAWEEASVPEQFTRKNAKSFGCVTEFNVKSDGQLEPSVKYVYDMEVDEGMVLKPGDSEVQEFKLMSVEEVKERVLEGRYKPMSAMVVIDFLVRHGVLTPENERDYVEIVGRTHRFLPFPTAPNTRVD